MEKFTMKTPDGLAANIAAMKKLFPEIVTEGKIDFEQLKTILGEEIAGDERYQFTWAGKRDAMYEASTPTTKTLRPCVEESKDWENTKNIYIEGDNLEALKILQNTYGGKVKMIYIDPPYNTGHDFIYHDNFHGTKQQELIKEGTVDEETGERFKVNSESNGHFHSDWCSMMYPRLKLARNLLRDDGVIVIHLDEHEIDALHFLCSEIFGERNSLGVIVWDKRNPKGEVGGVAQQHEYIACWAKDKAMFSENVDFRRKKPHAKEMILKVARIIRECGGVNERSRRQFKEWVNSYSELSGGERAYCLIDDDGNLYQPVSMAAPDKPETRSHRSLIHPITKKPCPVPSKGWRFPDLSMDALLSKGEIVFGEDETSQPRRKYLLKNNLFEPVSSLLYFGGSDDALGLPFENPKPLQVAEYLIHAVCKESDSIVLDFFSGSATTAHAVMQLNAEDGGNRKFILVQLPEVCAEGSEAAKAGYKNICEIGKERIRRAGEKIKAENATTAPNLDIGFRVFKVDSSNMDDIYFQPLEVQQQDMIRMINNVKTDRTALDLLFGCLLEWGLPIDLPITKRTDLGNDTYDVDGGRIIASFDSNVGDAVVKAIANKKPDFAIFRDLSFNNSAAKINVGEIFKAISPNTVVKVL